jgi:hypothetical protein
MIEDNERNINSAYVLIEKKEAEINQLRKDIGAGKAFIEMANKLLDPS